MAKMIVKKFTSSGSWTAPAGVTRVCVRAWGGGAGGDPGNLAPVNSAFGGGCAAERVAYVDVVPNTSYTITIGTGGAGGLASSPSYGENGTDTTFGSLVTAYGCTNFFGSSSSFFSGFMSEQGFGIITAVPYGLGAIGTSDGTAGGGVGGYSGPGGVGGAGGNASESGTASNGSAAAANTGAGGGAGGGTDLGTAGNGGAGGSGYCEVIWIG